MKDIYVSLTTIPSRMNLLPRILTGFINQTHTPKKVFVSIPRFSNRFQKEYQIPDALSKFVQTHETLFEIIRCDEDYGPATKLLGSFQHVPEDGSILVCDDDRFTANDFVEKFYKKLIEKDEARIIAGRYACQPGDTIKTPWGCNGILFPKKVIDVDIIECYHQLCPECQFVDDVFWYKYFIEFKKIPIEEVSGIRVSFELNGSNALYKETGLLERKPLQKKCFEKKIEKKNTESKIQK